MGARRTLLYLAREYPVPVSSPARLRTFNWILHLSSLFDITFVAPAQESLETDDLEVLRARCSDLLLPAPARGTDAWRRLAQWMLGGTAQAAGLSAMHHHMRIQGVRSAVKQALQQRRFDVAFGEHWTWRDVLLDGAPLAVLDAEPRGASRFRTISPGERDVALRGDHGPVGLLRQALLRRLREAEAAVLSRSHLVLVRNRAARREVLRASGGRTQVMIVPAGLDVVYFAGRRSPVHARNVVFFASLDRPRQRDALHFLYRSLLPRVRRRVGDVRLTVVAAAPVPDLEETLGGDHNVRIKAPEDPRAELARGAVAVMPVRFGPGSPNRLTQLLAMGIPAVVTPIAARGLDLDSGEGLLIATGVSDFSVAVSQVLLDTSLRLDLSHRARALAVTRYSLEATYGRAAEILRRATDTFTGFSSD